ncbi:hypothetical protein [Streptomyces flavofungini]|uniref:TetR family transcriptional regulator n=1 Tax=Streptomyces flavofungini TaxID=68200 RepID=A0ABS0WZE7_9ACTN|nr:hypothetical protein [Streptomyces flavofungini]MBJ3806297.1 hypothetical protein [Streptomyces flavofungini]GHC46061.1 hypothetical protein GCM10010349_08660 [Streptomyces flavofungini]
MPPPAARPGADFVIWTAVHGLATLLADGLITVDDPQAADRQTERVVRAVLTGLRQEPEATEPWPKVRSAHTERTAGRPRA